MCGHHRALLPYVCTTHRCLAAHTRCGALAASTQHVESTGRRQHRTGVERWQPSAPAIHANNASAVFSTLAGDWPLVGAAHWALASPWQVNWPPGSAAHWALASTLAGRLRLVGHWAAHWQGRGYCSGSTLAVSTRHSCTQRLRIGLHTGRETAAPHWAVHRQGRSYCSGSALAAAAAWASSLA